MGGPSPKGEIANGSEKGKQIFLIYFLHCPKGDSNLIENCEVLLFGICLHLKLGLKGLKTIPKLLRKFFFALHMHAHTKATS